MSAPKWQPGTIYPKGSVVQPATEQAAAFQSLVNGDFEAGDLTGWDVTQTGTGTASASSGRPYSGTYAGRWTGAYGGTGPNGGTIVVLLNTARCAVVPGQQVTAKAIIAQDDTSDSANYGAVRLYWYTAADALIKYDEATKIVAGNYSYYENNGLTASAPSGAAYARMGVWLVANGEGGMWVDNCGWSTNAPPTALGLIFKAVQPDPGTSAATEPTWPTANGLQVIDNTVTWEATTASYVEWTASPILESGATEPVWPTTIGEMVSDGTISWECIDRRIEDDKCPNSKVVAIMSSKVFAADGDIVRFSATTNPLDWSSQDDAGYLPTGLQQANADDLLVLQPYRGNLAAFNANCFQLWQTDPDPALMSLLDQMDGIGSQYTLAACGVGNDLFYLAALGVRSIGIANAAQNMQAGDVGMPIDSLVQEAISTQASVSEGRFISTYYPSAGQYWIASSDGGAGLRLVCGVPDGFVGESYQHTYTATGGTPPYTYSIASGALPSGWSLSAAGVLSGTATVAGSYSFAVIVTDSLGVVAGCGGWSGQEGEGPPPETEISVSSPFLGTLSGLESKTRPLSYDAQWQLPADTTVGSNIDSATRFGDYVFIVGGGSCWFSPPSSLSGYLAGPTGATTAGIFNGNLAAVGGKLWLPAGTGQLKYITSWADDTFQTVSDFGSYAMVAVAEANGVTVAVSQTGQIYNSANNLSFSLVNDIYLPAGLSSPVDCLASNGSRIAIIGDRYAPVVEFSDDAGGVFSSATFPATGYPSPRVIRWAGGSRWLVGCSIGSADTGLFMSTDGCANFAPVTLPVQLSIGRGQIAVHKGRCVVFGTQKGTSTTRAFWTDDYTNWNEISFVPSVATEPTTVKNIWNIAGPEE